MAYPQGEARLSGAANVVAHLGWYTHKTAIASHRLVDVDGENDRYRWSDYAHGNKMIMGLKAREFERWFLPHVLPRGFTRVRHHGVLASRGRTVRIVVRLLPRLLAKHIPASSSRRPTCLGTRRGLTEDSR